MFSVHSKYFVYRELKRTPQKLSFCFKCPDTGTVRILGNILVPDYMCFRIECVVKMIVALLACAFTWFVCDIRRTLNSKPGSSRPHTIHTRVFSNGVTAAILVSQNNETVAMLVSQTSPLGVELFSYANALFCYNKFANMLATWVKTLYTVKRVPLTKNRWRTPFVVCNNKIAWPLWAWISSQSVAKGFQRFHANEGVQTASLQASSPRGK